MEEYYYGHEAEFDSDRIRQDAILLNLQRACDRSIDLANHLVMIHELEVPRESKEVFDNLVKADLLDEDLASKMKNMVGFRNIALHHYGELDMEIVRSIIENHLEDFRAFIRFAVAYL